VRSSGFAMGPRCGRTRRGRRGGGTRWISPITTNLVFNVLSGPREPHHEQPLDCLTDCDARWIHDTGDCRVATNAAKWSGIVAMSSETRILPLLAASSRTSGSGVASATNPLAGRQSIVGTRLRSCLEITLPYIRNSGDEFRSSILYGTDLCGD